MTEQQAEQIIALLKWVTFLIWVTFVVNLFILVSVAHIQGAK